LIKKAVDAKKSSDQTSGSTHVLINGKYFSGELMYFLFKDKKIAQYDCMFINLHRPFHINTDPLGDERF